MLGKPPPQPTSVPLFVERIESGQLLLGSWGECRKLPQEPIQLLRGGSAWCRGHL